MQSNRKSDLLVCVNREDQDKRQRAPAVKVPVSCRFLCRHHRGPTWRWEAEITRFSPVSVPGLNAEEAAEKMAESSCSFKQRLMVELRDRLGMRMTHSPSGLTGVGVFSLRMRYTAAKERFWDASLWHIVQTPNWGTFLGISTVTADKKHVTGIHVTSAAEVAWFFFLVQSLFIRNLF